ncbi:MAG TPA: sialidase family protein, partial [Terriglobales bacterium]|nr:sialidase family protein [Terriglobales bacterium]
MSGTLFAQLPRPVSTPAGPEHDDPLARELWFRRGRMVPGKPGAAAQFLRRAYQQKMQSRAARFKANGSAMTAYSGALTTATPSSTSTSSYGGWVPLGPAPINSNASGSFDDQDYGPVVGRATAVVVDPGDPTGNTVYVGGAFGGVWKSTNAAASDPSAVTWTPLTDQQVTLATGSLALQPSSSGPSNVILVGTGEADFSIDSYYGLGMLRSTDGGNTWALAMSGSGNPFTGLAIAKIAFSTDNPNLVVAAAVGAGNVEGATNGGNYIQGLYTSTDGGQTWALTQPGMLFPDNSSGGATSVVYDPASHKFFAFLQFEGYYTSHDGMNWSQLASQPGATLHNCRGFCLAFRGEMAVVPGREELYTWYVTIDNQGNIGDGGIYKTTNAGSTWQQVSDTGITNCGDGANNGCGTQQGWFNLTVAAVPNGSGTDLYAGAVNLYKCSITAANSLCAAKPFINLTHVYGCTPIGSLAHVHPDQHGISFLQTSPSQVAMYFANDGGIYRALNGYALKSGTCGAAANPFQNLNGTMGSMAQFVDFSNSPTDAATLLGGTQDNGSPATDSTYGSKWISVNAGDGGYNAIDPASGNWFTSNTDVSVQRCGAGINCLAQNFDPVVTNSTVGGDHGFFYTPLILDPQATGRMMVGTCRLWRGNSDGSGFAPLAYNFDTVLDQVPDQSCSGNETQLIRSIAGGGPPTGNGSSVIYVGTEGGFDPVTQNPIPGHIWATNNADIGPFTWADVFPIFSGTSFPISSLAVDPNDPTGNTAYASIMGFGGPHVLRTIDQGLDWTFASPSSPNLNPLPNAPANAVLIDPDDSSTIYVGTDVGVFVSQDWQNWKELGQLPNVAVLQLHMFESGGVKQLRAGTYGRGLWSYDLPYQIRSTTPHVYLFPGQTGSI